MGAKESNNENEVVCTGCEYLGDDGCGPGTIMLCLHPYFTNAHSYENAIVQWRWDDLFKYKRVVSDECPKKRIT